MGGQGGLGLAEQLLVEGKVGLVCHRGPLLRDESGRDGQTRVVKNILSSAGFDTKK